VRSTRKRDAIDDELVEGNKAQKSNTASKMCFKAIRKEAK